MVMRIRMTPRHGRGWLVLVGIVVGVTGTTPKAALPDPPVVDSTQFPILNLRLTASNELPGGSRRALVTETESIWREGHLRLRWLAGSASPDSGLTLRVLVTPRAATSTTDGHRWTVGELLRFEGSKAIAVASIIGAQRIVEESRQFRLLDLPAVHHYRLGIVLGRAVAHEIGHYVLHTNTHAPSGLMRANIDAREFADLRTGTFRLDRAAQEHLAAQAARVLDSADTPESAFSYPAH